jgi:tricorn protease
MAFRSIILAILAAAAVHVFCTNACADDSSSTDQHLLLRSPSLSQDRIAFRYADDIWTVSRQGGEAQRLTSNGHVVAGPFYSPDGSQIAFTAHLRGNDDVYLVPANGGVPRRVTWHPAGSFVAGWSRDGKNILIASGMTSYRHFGRLFLVRGDGSGMPEPLPLPMGVEGSFSPDGLSIAYQPITKWQEAWKRYVGGQTTPIWILNLKTLDLVRVPRNNSNDSNPVWQGDAVYFLSDRGPDGPDSVALYKYDTHSKQVSQVGVNKGLDLKSVQGGPGGLVYEQFGSIHLVNTETNEDRVIPIQIHGELPDLAPHIAMIAAEEVQNAALSPSGARAVFEAHGEIFTVPGEKGDTRNLTRTSGTAERDPSWSPDGKTIAYFSDASGEYKLYLQEQSGIKEPMVIDLGPDPSFFYGPKWSPDSKHIVYMDKHNRLWVLDVPTDPKGPAPKPVQIDKGIYGGFGPDWSTVWSPDSKWVAYHRDLVNQLRAVFLYSMETHKSTQVTDGMSDAFSPAFDLNGKYLYFIESTNDGPSHAGIDLSSLDRAQTTAPYVVVLAKDGASPVPPESDDEKIKDEKKPEPPKVEPDKKTDTGSKTQSDAKSEDDSDKKDKDKKKEEKPADTKIDLDGIGARILSMPIPPRNYNAILAGKTGVIYLLEGPPVGRPANEGPSPNIPAVWRFTLEKRDPQSILNNVDSFAISADGAKVLYNRKAAWTIAPSDDLKPGNDNPGKPLNMSQMQATVDPRAEWRQMYHETWRIERDFLYDPNTHGLSIPKIEARYKPYLENMASRSEFTYLSTEMLGEITIGHMFVGGPDKHEKEPKCGLLGADYVIDHDRYRIAKILGGQNWTPGLASPLTLPGVYVKQGEYLLAVNGRELHANDNVYAAFDGTADKQTVIRVSPSADGKDARDVTVVPISDEDGLRSIDWVEGNRKKVDDLSGGKVAYVYMPNTAGAGYSSFNRYFYSQLDKKALVLDERWNEGGLIADYVVDVLKRFPLSGAIERDGKPIHDPVGAIFGPKVMLINQGSGSGGDANPWYFRKAAVGKLVGTRTWGGLVGIGGYPALLDGGAVMAPRYAIFGVNGDWEVENRGIPPDVEVELLPKDFADGHDRQLEEGVRIVLEDLKAHPVPELTLPPYPNYHKNDGLGKN